jgi:hypothetical protein
MTLFRLLLLLSLISPFTWHAATNGDDGRGIDPNGRPGITSSNCDEGNGLDPHGGPCRGNNALDAGVRIDPEG